MIGALLHAGRTVLFVSEKIAALDVVRNRLADAGLNSYLMELHSHKASRKEVATELLKGSKPTADQKLDDGTPYISVMPQLVGPDKVKDVVAAVRRARP